MKILHLLWACLLAGTTATAQRLVIEGRAKGIDSGKLYLKKYVDKYFILVDSARIERGKFFFNRPAYEVLGYGLTTRANDRAPQLFFAGVDTLQVTFDETNAKLDVKGSSSNEFYHAWKEPVQADGFPIDSLVKAEPKQAVVPYFILRDFAWRLSLDQLKALRADMDTTLNETFFVNQIDILIGGKERVLPGNTAPDFRLMSDRGTSVRLSDFRGSYVVLNFWASWCGDCRRELPMLVQAYERLKNKNVYFVGVSMDTDRTAWTSAIQKLGLSWTQLSDLQGWQSSIVAPYALRWIPSTFILSPKGEILSVSLNEKELTAALRTTFGD